MNAILLHDAVMYLTTEEDLYQTFVSQKLSSRRRNFLYRSRCLSRRFRRQFFAGGEDGFIDSIPVSVRLTEWHWRSSEQRNQVFVEFSMLIRHGEQEVQSIHETHTLGLFSREQYAHHLQKAGFAHIEFREDGILVK